MVSKMNPGVTPKASRNVALSSPWRRLIRSVNSPTRGNDGCMMSPLPTRSFRTSGRLFAVLSRTFVDPIVPAERTTLSARMVTVVPGGMFRPQGSTIVFPISVQGAFVTRRAPIARAPVRLCVGEKQLLNRNVGDHAHGGRLGLHRQDHGLAGPAPLSGHGGGRES